MVQDAGQAARSSLRWTGVILGVGIVGTLDEVVLHQLLQWHVFYVQATEYWRVVSDGIFHAVSSGLLLLGAYRLWRGRPLVADGGRALLAGVLFGMGGFNLYDGTVQHKLLQFHPVREGVADQLPYDLAFNAIALALIFGGWLIWRTIPATSR